ncbi:histidine phosphatase family protein [Planococcus sp. ISL-109]|uniref:histidine phosphatase family protein n=1 Tax=Planococcus sp. ISL-109 TaxID=2819166 RepID=UPI001BE8D1C0|nr:histidine phosphatase family protein [Planococcus sp. ISL-109]MBT2582185.1 histidine phosphatase family protein [Planococcus sp. ISL-109]
MTTICLIRHGETEWNKLGRIQGTTDVPLNERGISQAQACGVHLLAEEWDVIVTSPLERARQTAAIINENLGLPLVEMAEFQEKHFGKAEGLTAQERYGLYPDKNYPDQEQVDMFRRRLVSGLTQLNEQFGDKRILVVAHGGVIHTILEQLAFGEFDAATVRLQNGGMNRIKYTEQRWRIQACNFVGHLVALEVETKTNP